MIRKYDSGINHFLSFFENPFIVDFSIKTDKGNWIWISDSLLSQIILGRSLLSLFLFGDSRDYITNHPGLAEIFAPGGVTGSDIIS